MRAVSLKVSKFMTAKMQAFVLIAILPTLVDICNTCSADTITFGPSNATVNYLLDEGPQIEGLLRYEATQGNAWALGGVSGSPSRALSTFSNRASTVGNEVVFSIEGGGLFSFVSVDIYSASNSFGVNSTADGTTLSGFLDGQLVGTLTLLPTGNPINTLGFPGTIDHLHWTITFKASSGGTATAIDNLVLDISYIPNPSIPGDANSDGVVDLIDLDILGQNYGTVRTATFAEGDFDGDGTVHLLDLDILGANFGATAPVAIPEPASLAICLIGMAGLFLRRRTTLSE